MSIINFDKSVIGTIIVGLCVPSKEVSFKDYLSILPDAPHSNLERPGFQELRDHAKVLPLF